MPEVNLDQLRTRIRGEVIQPGDSAYDSARKVYNAMIDRRPAAIVYCAATEDAAACVRFAREHELPLAIHGGGHSVAGNAVAGSGVLVHIGKLKSVRGDAKNRHAPAEPGAARGD